MDDFLSKFAANLVSDGARELRDRFAFGDVRRAAEAYVAVSGFTGEDPPSDGQHFIVGHLLGYESALRRASIALSDPRARGVEGNVLAGLEAGLDIEDAIRKAQPPAEETERGVAPNVIPFTRKSK